MTTHDLESNGAIDCNGSFNTTFTVSGSWAVGDTDNCSANSTVIMTGTSETIQSLGSVANLTIDPASSGTITVVGLTQVFRVLTVAAGDTLSINNGVTLDHAAGGSSGPLVLNGTISGAGRYDYDHSESFPVTGVVSSILRFSGSGGQTMSARTYGGLVEIYNSGSTGRTVTMGSGTHTLSAGLNLIADGSGDVTLSGATNNPPVNITGGIDYTGAGAGSEILTTGTGTWTVGGSFDVTGGTFTATSGNTVVFNNAGQTSTISGAPTFHNFTCTTPGKPLRFAANETVTIASGGTLTLTGASGNLISLDRSGGTGSDRFALIVNSPQNVSYVSVTNAEVSGSSGNDITAADSTGGANTDSAEASPHWVFGAGGPGGTKIRGGTQLRGGSRVRP